MAVFPVFLCPEVRMPLQGDFFHKFLECGVLDSETSQWDLELLFKLSVLLCLFTGEQSKI